MVSTIEDVIELFGGPAAFAREVGMTPGAAKQARRRKSLNVKWIGPTARAAERRNLDLTETKLLEIAENSARLRAAERTA